MVKSMLGDLCSVIDEQRRELHEQRSHVEALRSTVETLSRREETFKQREQAQRAELANAIAKVTLESPLHNDSV